MRQRIIVGFFSRMLIYCAQTKMEVFYAYIPSTVVKFSNNKLICYSEMTVVYHSVYRILNSSR